MELTDFGTTFKHTVCDLKDINLYGELHRFIPLSPVCMAPACRSADSQCARAAGKSHYGLSRTFNVLLGHSDDPVSKQVLHSPHAFFGRLGLLGTHAGRLYSWGPRDLQADWPRSHSESRALIVAGALLFLTGLLMFSTVCSAKYSFERISKARVDRFTQCRDVLSSGERIPARRLDEEGIRHEGAKLKSAVLTLRQEQGCARAVPSPCMQNSTHTTG